MNAKEARRILAGTLHFGDSNQIRARQVLERIAIAKEIIQQCTSFVHFDYLCAPNRDRGKVKYLEQFEEEILDCEECRAKLRESEDLTIENLLAAIAELFDDWWIRATGKR